VSTLGQVCVAVFLLSIVVAAFVAVWPRRRYPVRQRDCMHHDIGGNPANTRTPVSWIKQELIDMGKRKRFWCTNCGRQWFA